MTLNLRSRSSNSNIGNSSSNNETRSFGEELLGEQLEGRRPPSPGLPLHRDTSNNGRMSNLELHESNAQQRRRGGPAAMNSGTGTGTYAEDVAANGDSNEKDYLMDRPDDDEEDSKKRLAGDKEKDKWSKLIPEDLLGGRTKPKQQLNRSRGVGIDAAVCSS